MANAWYYVKGEERMGPVSSAELKSLATSGELLPDDLVWKEGMDDWRPASDLKGLFPEQTAAAPESPATPPPESAPASATPAAAPVSAPAEEPAAAGFPVVESPAEPEPVIDTSPSRPTRRRSGGYSAAWQIPLLVGAVLQITVMFVPWWSFRLHGKAKDFSDAYEKNFAGKEEKRMFEDMKTEEFGGPRPKMGPGPRLVNRPPDEEKIRKFMKKVASSFGWYISNWSSITLDSKTWDQKLDESDPEVDIRGKIWGCNIGLGLGTAFVGLAILPLAVLMLVAPPLRQFSWATSLFAAYASLVLSILALLWYIDTPGFDVSPVFTQNASLGPYFAMAGCSLVLIFGIVDGVAGLRRFLRSRAASM